MGVPWGVVERDGWGRGRVWFGRLAGTGSGLAVNGNSLEILFGGYSRGHWPRWRGGFVCTLRGFGHYSPKFFPDCDFLANLLKD